MEQKAVLILVVLLLALLVPMTHADGMIHISDRDMWQPFAESGQFAAISYHDGIEQMLLTVDTGSQLSGSEAVWMFPVPASPEQVSIGISKGFPYFGGSDLGYRAGETVDDTFTAIRLTQIYTFPLYILGQSMGTLGNALTTPEGVDIYQSLERMGMTTELVAANSSSALASYLSSKGLDLPNTSKAMLDSYVGEGYSFVVSYISDVAAFRQAESSQGRGWTGSVLGVSVSFPTERIYFPLRPTSVYGAESVPAIVYVLGHVSPELYAGIRKGTAVTYFDGYVRAPQELSGFLAGYKTSPAESQPGLTDMVEASAVPYTKIRIDTPAQDYTEDLWMSPETPARVRFLEAVDHHPWYWGIAFLVVISMLASLLSGAIVFRKDKPNLPGLALLGLTNLLTIVGVAIASLVLASKNTYFKGKLQEPRASYTKIILISVGIALALPAMLWQLFWQEIRYGAGYYSAFVMAISLFGIGLAFALPFVWLGYRHKKVLKFVALFSVLFLVLTGVFQVLLHLLL